MEDGTILKHYVLIPLKNGGHPQRGEVDECSLEEPGEEQVIDYDMPISQLCTPKEWMQHCQHQKVIARRAGQS